MFPFTPDALADYGGIKTNYEAPVDPDTDFDAAELNRAHAATAAMSRTSIQAWVQMTGVDGYAPSIIKHQATWGTAVAPTVSRSSLGIMTLTFPATSYDALGNLGSINLNCGWANVEGAYPWQLNVRKLSPNSFEIRQMDTAASLFDLDGYTYTVFVL